MAGGSCRHWSCRQVVAAVLACDDQPLGLQEAQRGLDGGPDDLVVPGKLVLRGQLVARAQVAVRDPGAQRGRDLPKRGEGVDGRIGMTADRTGAASRLCPLPTVGEADASWMEFGHLFV